MKQGKTSFFAYFATEAGRKFVFRSATCFTLTLFASNYIPQTMLISQYKKLVQAYKSGLDIPVPDKVLQRLDIAFEKLKLSQFERKLIKPFTVLGFDIFYAGSTKYRFGGALGLPINYNYETINDIQRGDILFRNEQIKWSSESGELLEKSLILESDEQIFAMCKSILQMQTHYILMNSLYPTVSFFTVYTIGNIMNQKLFLLARPLSLRVVMYTILGLFGAGIWIFMKDYGQVQYDVEIDKKLCALGPDFIDAGVRYYEKILNKNIALRKLMENNTYTARGNENFLIRQKTLPLTFRKAYFEEQLKAINNPNQTTKIDENLVEIIE